MDQKKIQEEAARRAELSQLDPISFEELQARFEKWVLMTDKGIVKLLCAMVVAGRIAVRDDKDPVWFFLIGPSGGGKTQLLLSLFDLPDMYPISLLTPNTFLSGFPGPNDSSLLPKVSGKTLIFKDWTNILSQNKDAFKELMGQLRDIFDGHMKKPFGNGKIAEWQGRIGIIAGTTPAIDMAQQVHTILGERFVNYRLAMPDRKDVARRVLANARHGDQMKHEMRDAVYAFFKGLSIPEKLPHIPPEAEEEIVDLANFATMARSGVIRSFDFKKEVIFVPAVEMPTRITEQLDMLASAFMVINKGEFLEADMNVIYKVALDSIPQTNRMVILQMARRDNLETSEIATRLGYPTGPIHMYLENLAMLGVCRRIKAKDTDEGGTGDKWRLEKEFAQIVRRYEAILDENDEASIAEPEEMPPFFDHEFENQDPESPPGLGLEIP